MRHVILGSIALLTACSSTPGTSSNDDAGEFTNDAASIVVASDASTNVDATSVDASDAKAFDASSDAAVDLAALGTVTLQTSAVACTSGTWCVESSSIMAGFSPLHGAMSASGPTNVWWAGVPYDSTDGATLVHFDGTQWQRIKPKVAISPTAVWADSTTTLWLGDQFGAIAHFDGATWKTFTSQNGSAAVRAFWGASSNDVWAAYESGVIAHYVNGTWTPMNVQGTVQQSDFLALGGTSASDVWATGESGTVVHWTGSAWSLVASGTSNDLTGLFVVQNALIAVPYTTSEPPRRYDGAWTPLSFPSSQTSPTRSVDGRSTSDAYVVDEGGTIRHWNGSAWSVTKPTSATLRAVYAAPAGEAWAMGPSVIVHLEP